MGTRADAVIAVNIKKAPHRNLWFNIESNGRIAISFLRFQGSRAGLFYDLSARETCPLRCSPDPLDREPGLPPQISHEKTAPSRQSLRKDIATLPCLEHQNYFLPTNSYEEPLKRWAGAPWWCERGDSNPYRFPYWILSPARLPVPPLSQQVNKE